MLQVGDVEICYDLRHDGDQPLILLISGLSSQLISWDEDLCDMFVGGRVRCAAIRQS